MDELAHDIVRFSGDHLSEFLTACFFHGQGARLTLNSVQHHLNDFTLLCLITSSQAKLSLSLKVSLVQSPIAMDLFL